MVMDSTNALIADEPAHRLITKPTDTTSAWPLFRIVATVLPTSLVATSWSNTFPRNVSTCSLTLTMVSGPNQCATKPTDPSRASSSGAVDSADQNAACELIPNSESPQALDAVRAATLRQRCRTGPFASGSAAIGPVATRCHGTVMLS